MSEKCGCHVGRAVGRAPFVKHCALHGAAEQMRNLLERWKLEMDSDPERCWIDMNVDDDTREILATLLPAQEPATEDKP